MARMFNADKILGVVATLFGITSFVVLLSASKEQLLFLDADSVFIKYILVVFALNAGVYFLLMGVMLLNGNVVTYFSEKYSNKSQAKLNFVIITTMIPTLIWFTGIVVMSPRIPFVGAWLCFLCFLGWVWVSGFKKLMKKTAD